MTIPGADLRTDHEDEKHHDAKNAPDDSTTKGKESAEEKEESAKMQESTMVEHAQEVEHANRRFLQAIVDHWNEREKTAFIQDLTPIMDDYLNLADGKRA